MITSKDLHKICFFLAFFLLISLCTGCNSRGKRAKQRRIYLENWTYTLDGDEFVSITEDDIGSLARFLPESKGFITVNAEFTVPQIMEYESLALLLGKVMIAGQIFVNNELLEQLGRMPPKAFYAGNAPHCIRIPFNRLNFNGKNTLSVLIWIDGTGGISGQPFISDFDDVNIETRKQTFFLSILNLVFGCLAVLSATCYLVLYFSLNREREYLYYALMNISTAFYMIPFYSGELPWIMDIMGMLTFNKVFMGLAALYTAFFASSFVSEFLKRTQSLKTRIARMIIFTFAMLFVIFIPNMVMLYKLAGLMFFLIGIQLIFCINDVIYAFLHNRGQIYALAFGFSPVWIALACDFVDKIIIRNKNTPIFTIYGWQLTVVTFLIIVTSRYVLVRKRVGYLNTKLEAEVDARTKELKLTNIALEKHIKQAEYDMEMAVNVQTSFYQHEFDYSGWDIAVSFNPLSGVSGDLYDFYDIGGNLRGFGLYDVSGHGISSALVTMLVKELISNKFKETLSEDLSKVTKNINYSIIRTKGNIENYLTGTIFRIDENDENKLEFTNAGNPYPIFKSKNAKSAKLLLPDEKKPQFGMLGVPGMEVSFQTIPLTMKTGDAIILYTDGLTEAENFRGESFGVKRLQMLFSETNGSSQDMLNYIMADFKSFSAGTEIKDDITIIVLKKIKPDKNTAKSDEIDELEAVE